MIRENCWLDGAVLCLSCDSENVKRNGHDNVQVERQHYYCKSSKRDFDDLANTVFAGHAWTKKTPLKQGYRNHPLSMLKIGRQTDQTAPASQTERKLPRCQSGVTDA